MGKEWKGGRLRVLVADDCDRIREAIVLYLDTQFEIVAAVSTGVDLVEAALAVNPDVIVSDVSMPLLTGPEALKLLRRAGCRNAFVLVTTDVFDAAGWLKMGALGVVDKRDLHSDLIAAVQSAAVGEIYLSPNALES
jgi:DNA-binding NarL/FixJ family response regulator